MYADSSLWIAIMFDNNNFAIILNPMCNIVQHQDAGGMIKNLLSGPVLIEVASVKDTNNEKNKKSRNKSNFINYSHSVI